MTSQVECDLYYSIAGVPFTLRERMADNIEKVSTILNIYSIEEEELPNTTAIKKLPEVNTELSLPYPIKKGQFFNSESYCILLNRSDECLEIDGSYLFQITMMRDGSDFERLHVKFEPPQYKGRHAWKPVTS